MAEAVDYKQIGSRPVRPDGLDKVTGRAQFGADTVLPNMIHGKVLRRILTPTQKSSALMSALRSRCPAYSLRSAARIFPAAASKVRSAVKAAAR